MWDSSSNSLPSVLIVENESGDVFIVEDKKSAPQVQKILKTEKNKSRAVKIKAFGSLATPVS